MAFLKETRMSDPNSDKLCQYHYDHHTRIESQKQEIDRLEKKVEEITLKYIQTTTEFAADIKNIKEELKNLRDFIENKALRLKYIAMTICGISSFIVVGIVELIKIIFK